MLLRNLYLIIVLVALFIVPSSNARDFSLQVLPHAKNPMFEMSSVAKKSSYYTFVHSTIGRKIQALASSSKPGSTNESELAAGHGVSVKLSQNNYNIHVNFPNQATGGRSYGWTSGQVGDWSDKMYLDHLASIVTEKNSKDLGEFYELLIQMLGACNSDDKSLSIESLAENTQRVANNFLAIYTAEEYRAMVPEPHRNWDDALLEVTMLGAFHGGQSKFTKFYLRKFSTQSKEQGSGVYAKTQPGPMASKARGKNAEINDYWQFSANPTSKQSGINITRVDFEKMGEAITKYEKTVAHNRTMEKIQAVVGGDKTNLIKSISQFFTTGKSNDLSKIDELARNVSEFLLSIHDDADKITAWENKGEK